MMMPLTCRGLPGIKENEEALVKKKGNKRIGFSKIENGN